MLCVLLDIYVVYGAGIVFVFGNFRFVMATAGLDDVLPRHPRPEYRYAGEDGRFYSPRGASACGIGMPGESEDTFRPFICGDVSATRHGWRSG